MSTEALILFAHGAELDITTDQMQKGLILNSIDSCNAILEAVAKLPAVVDKMKKKN